MLRSGIARPDLCHVRALCFDYLKLGLTGVYDLAFM